ncbi:uncharacterized protein EV422DRAFT_546845 [Fimicolochytrium jonesii]|uniref:uncharacterized protein n=1 Tax=Fimicolochytrium jonesii TaxID=1396493 RepID=UPI0022FF02E1|nr:uncharacterized protein EV422DRAFT_546845 [Fimicolochytrium jonesii]KAI8816121.1 hypothetical protein EV422DRAFT_546845 [Fimicolochytrium jonesii]
MNCIEAVFGDGDGRIRREHVVVRTLAALPSQGDCGVVAFCKPFPFSFEGGDEGSLVVSLNRGDDLLGVREILFPFRNFIGCGVCGKARDAAKDGALRGLSVVLLVVVFRRLLVSDFGLGRRFVVVLRVIVVFVHGDDTAGVNTSVGLCTTPGRRANVSSRSRENPHRLPLARAASSNTLSVLIDGNHHGDQIVMYLCPER